MKYWQDFISVMIEKGKKKRFRQIPDNTLIFKKLFIYLILAALGLRWCARAFSSCGECGLLFVVVCMLIVVASLVAEHGL